MHHATPKALPVRLSSLCSALLALGLFATPAQAYLGPGSGLTALGSIIALLGVIGLGILGFLWYPVKRLLRKLRRTDAADPNLGNETE